MNPKKSKTGEMKAAAKLRAMRTDLQVVNFCEVCDASFVAQACAKYCSPECKNSARRKREKARAA